MKKSEAVKLKSLFDSILFRKIHNIPDTLEISVEYKEYYTGNDYIISCHLLAYDNITPFHSFIFNVNSDIKSILHRIDVYYKMYK